MNFDTITIQAIQALAEIDGVDPQDIWDQLGSECTSTTARVFNLICATMAQIEGDRIQSK